jgi:hypothetical protein
MKNRLRLKALILGAAILTGGCAQTESNRLPFDPVSAPGLTVAADFTDPQNNMGEVFDFFDVSVRTERANPKGVPAHFGRKKLVNTVRTLGGWRNEDISGDTYQWDGKKYIYNFDAATDRIDDWLRNDWDIFQIVLDNPPWAFQRGYTFVETPNGTDYLAKDRVGVYGNGLPPNDASAWNAYIQAFMQHLINTYGEDTVLSWRFRVGSEIDTRPQHWAGTRQQFFDHYKNTVDAVHAILPTATIGAHFREASFKSRYVDYTGNKEDSYALPFVKWAKDNKAHYDFIGVSYYPIIVNEASLDPEHIYSIDIAPIREHPDFNPDAGLEIHEFKLISKMQKGGFISVATSHGASFFAMLSKMILERDIKNVYQWGNQRNGHYSPDAMTQSMLHGMLGNQLFSSQTLGQTKITDNQVDGIFSRSDDGSKIDVLMYNFNAKDFSYQRPELTRVELRVDRAIGSEFRFRVGKINRFSNPTDKFYADFPKAGILEKNGGWRIAKVHHTAAVNKRLNEAGQKEFVRSLSKQVKTNAPNWSNWQKARVVGNMKGEAVIRIDTPIESFGVQKLEIRFNAALP